MSKHIFQEKKSKEILKFCLLKKKVIHAQSSKSSVFNVHFEHKLVC